MREHLISNPHRVVQTMSPVEGFTEDNQKVIDSVEEELIGQLSQSQKEEVVATGAELLEDQMKKADESTMACLPTLAIEDIAVIAPVYNLDPLSRGFVTRYGFK